MQYWTVLWITVLGGDFDGARFGMLYETFAACEAATGAVSSTLSYDHSLECEQSLAISASIRPRARPTDLTTQPATP